MKLGGKRQKVGIDASVFVAAAALALGSREPEGRRWRDDCRVGEQRS